MGSVLGIGKTLTFGLISASQSPLYQNMPLYKYQMISEMHTTLEHTHLLCSSMA